MQGFDWEIRIDFLSRSPCKTHDCTFRRPVCVAYMSPRNFRQLSPIFWNIGQKSAPVVGLNDVFGRYVFSILLHSPAPRRSRCANSISAGATDSLPRPEKPPPLHRCLGVQRIEKRPLLPTLRLELGAPPCFDGML